MKIIVKNFTAVKLKEKGFKEICKFYLSEIKSKDILNEEEFNLHPTYLCPDVSSINHNKLTIGVPTINQIIDWFYINHDIKIDYTKGNDGKFAPKLIEFKLKKEHIFDYSVEVITDSRETALENAILEALKLI